MERTEAFRVRAAAHSGEPQRAAQRWLNRVNDLDVATVLYAIEANGAEPYRIKSGRWVSQHRGQVPTTHDLSTVINEMIRTGLLRHMIDFGVDYLVPALVHLRDGGMSSCRFTGEDLGPMRARLVDDLALVDCLECEATVARGAPRGL